MSEKLNEKNQRRIQDLVNQQQHIQDTLEEVVMTIKDTKGLDGNYSVAVEEGEWVLKSQDEIEDEKAETQHESNNTEE